MIMRNQKSRNLTKFKSLNQDQTNINAEADYIVHRAQIHEAQIVTIPPLIFFSTEMGDAWIIDPKDNLALCLARNGQKQPHNIRDTQTKFSIEWNATYSIDEDVFVICESSGRIRSVLGYPVTEIQATIQNMQ